MYQETFYERLGVTRDATPEEIRRAYRDLARRLHPDKNVKPGETELFIDIKEAYETLIDPQKKSKYDQKLPKEFPTQQPLIFRTQFSRNSLIKMPNPQLIYVMLEIEPRPGVEEISTPSLNICLVLDCSTSMQGARLDTVKSTAIELIRQLHAQDVLSIVKFSDRAEVLVPASRGFDRKHVETRIQFLQAGGGTEIFQGLDLGFSEIRRYRNINQTHHIILITDGRTYGDEEDCLRLAEQANTLGIGISALGIGSQWNDIFLDQLVTLTGGSSKYISKAKNIRRFLIEKVAGLGKSFAEHVTYSYDTPDGIELSYAFRLQPDSSPLENRSPLVMGSVQRDTTYSLILEFLINEIPEETKQISFATGRIIYETPGNNSKSKYIERLDLTRSISDEPDIEPPPPNIVQAMSRLTLYRMQERARVDMEKGDIQEATRRLQNIATHLLAQGQQDLAKSVLGEVAYIQQNQTFSEEGDKKIKYGTRSLLLSGKSIEE
jgi:Ca-activated chloride channel family protein